MSHTCGRQKTLLFNGILSFQFLQFLEQLLNTVRNPITLIFAELVIIKLIAAFNTTSGDISFGTQFHARDRPVETVIETSRVQSDVESITGSFKATQEGTFVLVFDNSYSWFTSKVLSYKVELFQVSRKILL